MKSRADLTEAERVLIDSALRAYEEQCARFARADPELEEVWARCADHSSRLRERLEDADWIAVGRDAA
jgi:hypothetical protein